MASASASASASGDHGIHHHITYDTVSCDNMKDKTGTEAQAEEEIDEDNSNDKRDRKQEPQELTNNCEYEYEHEYVFEYIDVVWLKRDVRMIDHGPLSEVLTGARTAATQIPMGRNNTTKQQQRKFVILYLYEPDQLREPTVHGSHLRFIHEGLIDMEQQLNVKVMMKTNNKMMKKSMPTSSATSFSSSHVINGDNTATCSNSDDISATTTNTKSSTTHSANANDGTTFKYLTVCHNTIISTLESIHFRYSASPSSSSSSSPSPNTGTGAATATATAIDTSSTSEKKKKLLKLKYYKISRLLAHEETGHWQSYMRDNDVRKWCKIRSIPFIEYNQTGVTRCLSNRDDYLKKFKLFISKPIHPLKLSSLSLSVSSSLQSRLFQLDRLPGFLSSPRSIANIFDDNDDEQNSDNISISNGSSILSELLPAHRSDRVGRQQFGGESKAIDVLNSFLFERGATYSKDISSPNTSMNSCSRLSPYLTWGHISLRYVFKCLEERRETLRQQKLQGIDIGSTSWLRSLQAFASRIHWRSHFLQKLESEPLLEKQDLCSAYQHLRRQPNDWDENKYIAWSTGKTGYPFVDACMRCLIEHGWINFRMRAMLVSFATYNLWLDWKKIAPHLARVFLDYEPGIHYPQLQMQAGTSGINAMRVYNVTKQSKDQDPKGVFIRRYIRELRNVPDQYIHEPWKMPIATRQRYCKMMSPKSNNIDYDYDDDDSLWYPEPIVEEIESARIAKEKINYVKKAEATRMQANQVYIKHGSRGRQSNEMNGRASGGGALPAVVAAISSTPYADHKGSLQPKINDIFTVNKNGDNKKKKEADIVDLTTNNPTQDRSNMSIGNNTKQKSGLSSSNSREKKMPALFAKQSNHPPKIPSFAETSPIDLTETQVHASPFKRLKKSASADNMDCHRSLSATATNQHHPSQISQDSILPIATTRTAHMTSKYTKTKTSKSSKAFFAPNATVSREESAEGNWICTACTFSNDKPHGLICSICGTKR